MRIPFLQILSNNSRTWSKTCFYPRLNLICKHVSTKLTIKKFLLDLLPYSQHNFQQLRIRLTSKPSSHAFLATRPAPSMTLGFDVFVQLVMAAMTTLPCFSSAGCPWNENLITLFCSSFGTPKPCRQLINHTQGNKSSTYLDNLTPTELGKRKKEKSSTSCQPMENVNFQITLNPTFLSRHACQSAFMSFKGTRSWGLLRSELSNIPQRITKQSILRGFNTQKTDGNKVYRFGPETQGSTSDRSNCK